MFKLKLFCLLPRPLSTFCSQPHTFCLLFLQMIFFFTGSTSLGISTETLPANIYSPAVKYGQINGLESRYSQTGTLVRLTDLKSIEFDSETLAKFNSKAEELISTLNKFGLYKAGDLFNLGTLEIDTKPQINYFAPIFAKGVSDTWTVGVGLPVIQYSNQITLSQKFSNIEYYNQFRGLSAELDRALDTDLAVETQNALINKGYKPLESQDQQFIGDLQVVSLKKIFKNDESTLLHLLTLTLPTGPNYDADNLLALNSFHELSVENKIIYSHKLFYYLDLIPSVSTKYYVPQKVTARIPKNKDDLLPNEDSKDEITKSSGLSFDAALNIALSISEQFNIGAGYSVGQKLKDSYSASTKGNSEILADESQSKWQKVSADINYSTVQTYLRSKKYIPLIVGFSIFDTIAGENIERRLGQELNMTLFF